MDLRNIEENIDRASTLLKALSNPQRLAILCALSQAEKSVSELESFVDLSQSALSQHLARLRRDGLVQTRREAQNIFYSLNGKDVHAILETLHDLYCPAEEQTPAAQI